MKIKIGILPPCKYLGITDKTIVFGYLHFELAKKLSYRYLNRTIGSYYNIGEFDFVIIKVIQFLYINNWLKYYKLKYFGEVKDKEG